MSGTDILPFLVPPALKWTVPLTLTFIALSLAALCMQYTQHGSPLRWMVVLSAVPIFRLAYLTAKDFTTSGYWAGHITAFSFWGQCVILNLLIIKGINAADLTKLKTDYGYRWGGFLLAFGLTINTRAVRTPWLSKNTPSWPKWYALPEKDTKLAGTTRRPAPRLGIWLLRTVAFLMWHIIIIDLINSLPTPKSAIEMCPPGSEWKYFGVTSEEWINRVIQVFISWWIAGRIVLDFSCRLTALIFVLLGLSTPEDWPPMFNSMADAYTLRHFWGKFWHQLLRGSFQSTATYVTRDLLNLPKPSLLERYTNLYFVFLLSAIMHFHHDGAQFKGPQIGTLLFFQSFAFGIMFEDGVQELWRIITKKHDKIDTFNNNGTIKKSSGHSDKVKDKREKVTPLWQKIIGYIWVFGFFVMVNPIYMYPNVRQPPETFWIIPFRIADNIGLPASATLVAVGALILKFGFGGEI